MHIYRGKTVDLIPWMHNLVRLEKRAKVTFYPGVRLKICAEITIQLEKIRFASKKVLKLLFTWERFGSPRKIAEVTIHMGKILFTSKNVPKLLLTRKSFGLPRKRAKFTNLP